jgi:hypothetical protein
MGYAHIENLYKRQDVLMFKEVYALEKIHGTSAHLSWREGKLHLHSGGASSAAFMGLFDLAKLVEAFGKLGHANVTVYGEAYGGSVMKMRPTYGPTLRFVVFDVQIGDTWLNVPNAEDVAHKLGLEFVAYEKVAAEVAVLDFERDRSSRQAIRNGMGDGHHAEGIVIRPLQELIRSNGERVIAKHKRLEFAERASGADTKVVDPAMLAGLAEAEKIAMEWVTDMRMLHVTERLKATLGRPPEMKDTSAVLTAMKEDVYREAGAEVVRSRAADHAISTRARILFHAGIQKIQIGTNEG